MNRRVHRNPDGLYVHFCTDCGFANQPSPYPTMAYRCRCPTQNQKNIQLPAATVGAKPATTKPGRFPSRFVMPRVKCAFLGGEQGEPVKVTCGNKYQQPQECLCSERPAKVGRDGEPLPKLAAWDWWCGDLGKAKNDAPVKLKHCGTCPFYRPQLLLTLDVLGFASESDH